MKPAEPTAKAGQPKVGQIKGKGAPAVPTPLKTSWLNADDNELPNADSRLANTAIVALPKGTGPYVRTMKMWSICAV